MRKAERLTQEAFWGRVGVSQSGGSRYESGRPLPEPVIIMVTLAYCSEREREPLLAMLRPGSDVSFGAPTTLHPA